MMLKYRILKRGETKLPGDEWKYSNETEWKPCVFVNCEYHQLDPSVTVRRLDAYSTALEHVARRWTYWPHPSDYPTPPPDGWTWGQTHPRGPWRLRNIDGWKMIDGYLWWMRRKQIQSEAQRVKDAWVHDAPRINL
jgi:hypothetical protein